MKKFLFSIGFFTFYCNASDFHIILNSEHKNDISNSTTPSDRKRKHTDQQEKDYYSFKKKRDLKLKTALNSAQQESIYNFYDKKNNDSQKSNNIPSDKVLQELANAHANKKTKIEKSKNINFDQLHNTIINNCYTILCNKKMIIKINNNNK
jgi:hypothetical protein